MQNAEKMNYKKQQEREQEGQSLIQSVKGIAEHLVALAAISLLSFLAAKIGGQYFDKSSEMIFWVAIIVGAACIGHALLMSLHYLFPHGINIQRKLAPHIAVFLLLLFLLMATSSVTLLSLNKEPAAADSNFKIHDIFPMARDINEKIADNGRIENRHIQDILASGTNLIRRIKNPSKNIRATVVYIDTSREYLVMPPNGYYGEGFDSDLPKKLYFDVRNKANDETDMEYSLRLGFAGCAFKNEKELIDNDIEHQLPSETCIFKDVKATQKLQRDFAMICMPIYKTSNSKREVIGVLSVSSIEKTEFTEEEIEIVRYLASVLSKTNTPIEAPAWLKEKKH
jgi:hypothetical protein